MEDGLEISYPKEKINIVLAETIDSVSEKVFQEFGYCSIRKVKDGLKDDELIKEIKEAHIFGVRSGTKLRRNYISEAKHLLAIGCYSVGTDQVDIDFSRKIGVPVFNAPYSNTRSVAELTISNVIDLARKKGDKNIEMHNGIWNKVYEDCHTILGKTLGIIGYGNIGSQVGEIASVIGMNVLYFDLVKKQSIGRVTRVNTIEEVLRNSDFVSVHVPAKDNTDLISEKEFEIMKSGSYLLNLSRGNVVNLDALVNALKSGKLSGAALDVYPSEPEVSESLRGLENVILTPHIGGNTEEAQRDIGEYVSKLLVDFIETGNSLGAVNFPRISLPPRKDSHRILSVHENVPGALTSINEVISNASANIDAQVLGTEDGIGYLIIDINKSVSRKVKKGIESLPISIKTRILY